MSRTKRRLRVVATLGVLYVLLMIFGGCADRLILYPPRGKIDAGAATRKVIPSDGREIEIWVARSPVLNSADAQAYVLEFCGNATRAEQIAQYVAQRWQNHPVEVWVMNYAGYGGSTGGAKLKLIPPSALATFDELRQIAGSKPIFLAGNSLGTTAALYVASQRPVAGLILQNPPPVQRIILQRFGWWNLWLLAGPVAMQVPREMDATKTAPQVHAPAVFILADKDNTVPPYYHNIVVSAYAGPKAIIRMSQGDHNSSVEGESEAQLHAEIDKLWAKAFP